MLVSLQEYAQITRIGALRLLKRYYFAFLPLYHSGVGPGFHQLQLPECLTVSHNKHVRSRVDRPEPSSYFSQKEKTEKRTSCW